MRITNQDGDVILYASTIRVFKADEYTAKVIAEGLTKDGGPAAFTLVFTTQELAMIQRAVG